MKTRQSLFVLILFALSANIAFAQKNAPAEGSLAVLPFTFISNDPAFDPSTLETQMQMECINIFRGELKGVEVQDPRTTNAMLAKNNITSQDLATSLPADLASVLGVDYVVFASTDIENKGTTTVSSTSDNYSKERKRDEGKDKTKSSGYTSSSTTTQTKYETRVQMDIYNAQGKNLFSRSKTAVFGEDSDAYLSTLKYLAKRTPWGKKAGKK